MTTATKPQIVAGFYYTDGSALIYIVRVEPEGDVLAEDAKSTNLIHMTPDELQNWKQVLRGT